ncbi:hypothetical protein B0H10DRAFT_2228605 [Mycena sp. CBHHK59/15]|nr:hypothetical protein B0H10DRAFT_2228605 [Mycena sp. CBHHK59/15]
MPLAARRAQRAGALWKSYIRNHKGRQRRALLRRRAAARARQANPAPRTSLFGVDLDFGASSGSDSSTSSDSSSSSSDTSSDDSQWSDILGPTGASPATSPWTGNTPSQDLRPPPRRLTFRDARDSVGGLGLFQLRLWFRLWLELVLGAEGDDEDSGDSDDEDTADQQS